jgi:coproporphyrinogen III oxidase-like Fe-S oxidoreductase
MHLSNAPTILNEADAKVAMQEIWVEYLAKKTPRDYTTIYIHVPYCTQKCTYCEYFSKIIEVGRFPDRLIGQLEQQFQEAAPFFEKEPIKAFNFGGGTPNLLSPDQLDRVLSLLEKYWNIAYGDENERGFEFNPHHLTSEHIDVLRSHRINRLSMGSQSFNAHVIEKENRIYSSPERIHEIYESVKDFARVVNVDLLAGLIDQTPEILLQDVATLLSIGVEAITIYELHRVAGHDTNPESTREAITKMLLQVYERYKNYPGYYYVGTTPEEFNHCNRLYKRHTGFETFYNPAPQGFNSIIAFNMDDKAVRTHPYSHFLPINKAYQKLYNGTTHFYQPDSRSDRSFWISGAKRRKDSLDA